MEQTEIKQRMKVMISGASNRRQANEKCLALLLQKGLINL